MGNEETGTPEQEELFPSSEQKESKIIIGKSAVDLKREEDPTSVTKPKPLRIPDPEAEIRKMQRIKKEENPHPQTPDKT